MLVQITAKEALKLVSFYHTDDCGWQILNVRSNVNGYVAGDITGNVGGDITGDVFGDVSGKINGRQWEFIETPKDKLQRLIAKSGNQELIDTFNQMENN